MVLQPCKPGRPTTIDPSKLSAGQQIALCSTATMFSLNRSIDLSAIYPPARFGRTLARLLLTSLASIESYSSLERWRKVQQGCIYRMSYQRQSLDILMTGASYSLFTPFYTGPTSMRTCCGSGTANQCCAETRGIAGVTRTPTLSWSLEFYVCLEECGCYGRFEFSFHCFIPARVAFWHTYRGY